MSEMNFSIGHMHNLETPWGNAGGVVRSLEELEIMARGGGGWSEVGSYTIEPRLGNDKDSVTGEQLDIAVFCYNQETGEAGNSLGMPNYGFDVVEKQIPEMRKITHKHGQKLIVNVAPVSDYPVTESQELVARAYEAGADMVLLNGGCPNVISEDGGRHDILSLNVNALYWVLDGLKEVVQKYKPIGLRVSPIDNFYHFHNVFDVIKRSGVVSAVWTPNTEPGYRPLDADGEPVLGVPGGTGGKSGPAFAQRSATQTHWAVQNLRGTGIDVVRSSGIMDCEAIEVSAAYELKRSLDIGAVAAAGTTFYYVPRDGLLEDTERLIKQFSEL